MVGGSVLTDLVTDVRYVVRSARRQPWIWLTLVTTLALGLGLGGAIFSFADGYLFRSLPYPDPEQLYVVRDPQAPIALLERDTIALRQSSVGPFGFVEWSAGHRVTGSEMIVDGQPIHLWTNDVTPGFGQALRLPLVAGRLFVDADHRPSATIPALITHRFWQKQFGGDRGVLNRSFQVTGDPPAQITIVGILGSEVSSFDANNAPPDLVMPGVIGDPSRGNPATRLSRPIVRLPASMSRQQGEARIAAALEAVSPGQNGHPRVIQLRPLEDVQLAGGRPTARVLFAGAVLVLLLVAINLAHLLLAQGVARSAESATRVALGASRWRIARLFVLESLCIGALGIASGLILGGWLSEIVASRVPLYPTSGRNLSIVPMLFGSRTIGIVIATGVTIAALSGLWPAWRAIRRPLYLTARGTAGVESRLPARVSRVVLASELAVATVLLLGAVFITRGIWGYLHRPLGFSYEDRLAVGVGLDNAGKGSPPDARDWETVRDAIAAVPGVKSVGVYQLDGEMPVAVAGAVVPKADAYGVTSGYFDAWQVRLLTGRFFSPEEFRTEAPVAVVDAAFARRVWPDGDAIGRDVQAGSGPARRIIGVVAPQVRRLTMETPTEVYIPRLHAGGWPRFVVWAPGLGSEQLVARLAPLVGRTLPAATVRAEPVTLTWLFNRETGEAEFQGPIMIAFAILTFVLAGIGVFGLVSYLVAQRTREFGIRLALGARSRDIWSAVAREGIVPLCAGIAVGSAAAFALERVVRASVFGWSSSGGAAFAIVSAALLVIAAAATAAPARRAIRTDPSIVLREG